MNRFVTNFKRKFTSVAVFMALLLSLTPGFTVPASAQVVQTQIYFNLVLTPGANETEMGISWHSAAEIAAAYLGISERGNPETYRELEAATRGNHANVTAFTPFRYNVHQLTVTGLKPATTYDYVVIQGAETSDTLSFTTGDAEYFTFFATGDIQIGADGSALNRDWQAENWKTAVDIMTKEFPYASFIASAGDQIETGISSPNSTNVNNAQIEYNLLLSAEKLSSLPIAPSVGNHDVGNLFIDHYNIPGGENKKDHSASVSSQFDYWYRYGNTLVIVLDSNRSNNAGDAASRRPFFEEVVKQNKDATWKVVMFHHPPYSAYRLESDADKTNIRENWNPIFEDNGIDVVISGHCHSYNRTFQMLSSRLNGVEDLPQKDQMWLDANGKIQSDDTGLLYNSVLNPTGIVYFALNTTTGAKFYMPGMTGGATGAVPRYHTAAYNQEQLPNFTVVDVTPISFTVSTYQIDGQPATAGTAGSRPENATVINSDDSITLVDTYTIYKASELKANLEISYQLVSTTRVGTTSFDYVLKAFATNSGDADAKNVSAELTDMPTRITAVSFENQNGLVFGNVPVGTTVESEKTFTVRMDRSVAFDEKLLNFRFDYEK